MNLLHFNTSVSPIQYDVYKYKLDNKISYNKRRSYKYKSGDCIYDLRTEDNYKYLFEVRVSADTWSKFINNDWEYQLVYLNLVDLVIDHLSGFISGNKFNNIIFPDELGEVFELIPLPKYKNLAQTNRTLRVNWFESEIKENNDKESCLDIVIFKH